MEAVNNQLTDRPRPGLSSSCFEGQHVGITAVGELIWSELMEDEQMYPVLGMFEMLSSIFRANLRDLDVNLRESAGI